MVPDLLDYSHTIYKDAVKMFTPPCALKTDHWIAPNPDDPDTYTNPDEDGDHITHLTERLGDLSDSDRGDFTYTMINQGNYKIGFGYPCEATDENPVSYYTGNNTRILSPKDQGPSKIVWPHITYMHWFRHMDLMYDMNKYTIMDMSLDDMVDKIDELPMLENFFNMIRNPIIFNEKISMRPAPFDGEITGNLSNTDANRNNTWHGYYSHYKFMHDNLLIDTVGHDKVGEPFSDLNTNHFENHKGLNVPEFYKKTVLSGDTNKMPEDAPFRYQGAYPVKCLTDYENVDGLTDFKINATNNLGPGSSNSINRLDKMIRTYAMAVGRKDILARRIKFLAAQLQEALDWVDTQGDDQANTAVTDED